MLCRRLDRFPVEQDGKLFTVQAHGDLFVEALWKRLLHLNLRTTGRIWMAKTIWKIKEFSHFRASSANQSQKVVWCPGNRVRTGGKQIGN